MDCVKAKAWKGFIVKNSILPPAYDRLIKETDTPTPFCINLKNLEGIDVKSTSPRTEYQLRITLFDVAYKQFFGRSWTGPLQSAKTSGGKHKIVFNQSVYFYTSVKDINIVIVFELNAVENNDGKSRRYSKGWTFHRLFASDDVIDVSTNREASSQRLNIYAGTPRALYHLEDPIEKNENVSILSGSTLMCGLMTNSYLLKMQHLLPENVIIGANDIVPGVVDSIHTDSPLKDCFRKPKLLKCMKAFLDNVSVTLYPNIEKFEDELLTLLNEDRLNRENLVADGSSVCIAERRLMVGVHNGFCYVEKPEVAHLVPQDLSQRRGSSMRKHQRSSSYTSLNSANLGSTFVLRDRVPVNGMVYDPMFTIVFTLEYMISEPLSKTSNHLSMSMNKTQSFPVAVRWTAWSPFTKPPAPGEQLCLSFVGGPSPNPDQVFTYKVPKFDMESQAAIKEMTGTMSFNFIDTKKELMHGQDVLGSGSLAVPYQQQQVVASGYAPPPGGYISESSGYTESMLPAGGVAGKPPRSAPTTPSSSQRIRSTASVSSWSRQPPPPLVNRASLAHQSLVSQTSPVAERRAMPDANYSSPGMPTATPQPGYATHGSPQHTGYMVPPHQQQQPMLYPYQQPGGPVYMQQPQNAQYQGHVMSLPPPPTGHPIGPVGYPMEIRHLSDPGSHGDVTVGGGGPDLEELPFTPVHATIMAVPPGSNTGSRLSRAAYARLYAANFPPILDRHKQDAEVVNPNDYLNFIMAREESDQLQCNEIILQFLAFSRMSLVRAEGSSDSHSTVFFTFQFYKFPHITTERLLLGEPEQQLTADRSAQPCILRRLAPDGKIKEGPAGYQIKYVVDPTHMKPGEGSLFVRHMSQQTLHIDVWDGDSLLLIGSSAVELKHLCRQGREGVQVTYELDIMASEVSEDRGHSYTGDLSRGGSVRPVGVHTSLRGKLHLRLANIGHTVDTKYLPKSRTLPNAQTTAVVKPEKGEMQGSFIGGSLSSIQNTAELHRRSARANHLSQTNTELASLLHSRHNQPNDEENVVKKNKKLARMLAVRDAKAQQPTTEGGGDENKAIKSLMSYKHQKAERARDLKIMEAYRSQSKADGIRSMLNQAITTEHIIHPSMGTTEFFEYQLTNPNNSEATISIRTDCEELSVITDAREWRHFKQLYKLDTPIEEGMFNTEVTKRDPEVFLRPKETVYIPMKYVSFEANHACSPESPGGSDLNAGMRSTNAAGLSKTMSTRMYKVHFNALGDNKLIGILAVRVEPEPHVIDQTFRFHQPEQSFLKKSIRLPPFQNTISGMVDRSGYQQLMVKCSDQNVICESYKRQNGEPQDVFVKAAVGASPQQKKFFVCIYSDVFLSKPDQIWQFYVHALQRVDVSCVEGQTTRLSLILRGTQSSRLVRCFTSHSGQMQVSPSEPFMLAAGAVHELHVGVKPLQSGTKFFYLNVVDVECHQLVRNWLVCVSCSAPVISKTFELHLTAGKSSNKRISFTNPYPNPKVFLLTNNRNDLLQFKDSRLDMHPKETRVIGLRFMPAQNTGSTEIMIFINDDEDKNEETFCVKLNYISETTDDD